MFLQQKWNINQIQWLQYYDLNNIRNTLSMADTVKYGIERVPENCGNLQELPQFQDNKCQLFKKHLNW